LRRLIRRSLASWPIWVALAAVASAGLTAAGARRPPKYTVTVGLVVSGGAIRTQAQFNAAQLRAQLMDLTFTHGRLQDLIKRHRADLPKDPDVAYEEIMENVKIEILENEFIENPYDEADRPRTARVLLSLTGLRPQAVWQMVHEMADLMIDSTLARQRATLLRERAAATAALGVAQATSVDAPTTEQWVARDRVRTKELDSAAARLGLRAAEQNHGLRFELVDAGRMPEKPSRAAFIGDGFVTFGWLLLAACLLVGAFDPRVLEVGDLAGVGVPMIGRLPALPAPPPRAPRNAPDTSPPPSADSGPRV
jgi:hypothetical protein